MTLAHDRTGSGPPLVLLHPLGGDRRVWGPVVDLLAPHREVVTVDLPGFGGSAPLGGDGAPDPPALARAVAAWMDDAGLGGGRAHVAGNSLGGWVALETALAGAAASVTAIAPAGLWARPLPPRPEVARRAAQAARPVLGTLLRSPRARHAALAGVVARPDRVPRRDAVALVRAYADAPGYTEVNAAMRASTFSRLADVRVPVTLVWPQHDRLVGRPRRIPACVREVLLPGAGHLPMWDAPAAVAEILLAGSAA